MIKIFREYWFGIILSVFVLCCACFVFVIGVAPHQDMKMRGFAPCTYTMATELGESDEKVKPSDVAKIVGNGFACYARVMKDGAALFIEGKQETPWANYLFEPEVLKDNFEDGEAEPYSQDLLEANLLDEELSDDEIKENEND